MFSVPDILSRIPEIQKMYEINEKQLNALYASIDKLDNNIFADSMDEAQIKRLETMLSLYPGDDDTLEERRFAVKTKLSGSKSYSYYSLKQKLTELCNDVELEWSYQHLDVKVALTSANMAKRIDELLDAILPLDMTYNVIILYNTWNDLKKYTFQELSSYTWQQLKTDLTLR